MNTDSNKVLSIAFIIIVPVLIATISYGVLKGDGDPIQAIKDARKPRNIFDDLSDMHLKYARGEWEEALKFARLVLARDPHREDALRAVASCHLQLKHPERAAVTMKTLLKEIPEDVPTRISLAKTLLLLGEKDESRDQWKLVEKSPFASRGERKLAEETLMAMDDGYGGLLASPKPSGIAPEGNTDKNRVQ